MKKAAVALAALLAVSACAGPKYVVSDVTRYHDLPRAADGRTFTIMPSNEDQKTSIAFETFSDIVADALKARGLRQFDGGSANPDLVVTMTYDVEGPSPDTYSRNYGGHIGFGYGPYSRWGYYGGYGYGGNNDVRTKQIYVRRVDLDIFDGATYGTDNAERVFEGTAVSEGRTNAVEPVLPYMIQALFKDFPGASGETKKVKIEVPENPETGYRSSTPKARSSY